MSELEPPGPSIPHVLHLLHRLWSKAVGTSDYNKKEWKEFEAEVESYVYVKRKSGEENGKV
jgi:hypothetical protein